MSETPLPFASVVVPVFNDHAELERCLEALEGQSYPPDRYEVIVVDNGSDEPFDDEVSRFPRARVTAETRIGAYAARNAGVKQARGSVLAFTDADCTPASDWLERGIARLGAHKEVGLVAGRVDLMIGDRPSGFELFERVAYLRQQEYIETKRFGATANLFTWREVWARVGPFDEAFRSSGDREWGERVAAAGYQLAYADEVRVTHHAHTPGAFMRRRLRLAGGHHQLRLRTDPSLRGRVKAVLQAFTPPVRYAILLTRDPRLQGTSERIRVAVLAFVVRYLEALETLRLTLGGRPRR